MKKSTEAITTVSTIGPSMMDLAFDMSARPKSYEKVMALLQTNPGGWARINSLEQFQETMRILLKKELPENPSELLRLSKEVGFSIVAGSTNLGMLSALDAKLRAGSSFISSIGTSLKTKNVDLWGQLFSKSLKDLKIEHIAQKIPGSSPIGIVIGTKHETEKVLALFPGVSNDLSEIPDSIGKSKIIYVDAFELQKGEISQTIDKLIENKTARIALNLGNHSILTKALIKKIKSHIDRGLISILVGNEDEYAKLLGRKIINDPDDIKKAAETLNVPSILFTFGKNGLSSVINHQIFTQKPYEIPDDKMVNTSGAGDTSAGVFIAGVLNGENSQEVLKEAAFYSAQVLQIPESRIVNGR